MFRRAANSRTSGALATKGARKPRSRPPSRPAEMFPRRLTFDGRIPMAMEVVKIIIITSQIPDGTNNCRELLPITQHFIAPYPPSIFYNKCHILDFTGEREECFLAFWIPNFVRKEKFNYVAAKRYMIRDSIGNRMIGEGIAIRSRES